MPKMNDSFLTISKHAEGSYKKSGSKFLAHAWPIEQLSEVRSHVDALRAAHPTARHVCFAFVLGAVPETYRANDDGEPSGSAGLPILNQIRSRGVTNTLIAVVRYFGGTKLGIPGLINAYKTAANEALENTNTVEKIPTAQLHLHFPMSSIGAVERLIRQRKYVISAQEFGETCSWTLKVAKSEVSSASELLMRIDGLSLVGED